MARKTRPLPPKELAELRILVDGFDMSVPDEKTIARLLATVSSLEKERARVQCKLTDICSDIWDAARRHDVTIKAGGRFTEERATLRRILTKLTENADG